MLKVLVLSHMFPRPHHTVGGIFVMEQVQALRRQGIDARVLSGDPYWVTKLKPSGLIGYARAWRHANLHWQWQDCVGVPVVFFPYLAGGLFRPWLHSWTYEFGLRSVLAEIRKSFCFDIIHAHTAYLDGNAGLHARSVANTPLVITEHTGPFSLLTNHPLKKLVTRRAVKGADRILAVGKSLQRDMQKELKLDKNVIDVLSNGYDNRIFQLGSLQGYKRKEVRALWVGHFVKVKRIDRLIDAFDKIAYQAPFLTISLIGDGEGLKQAKQEVERRRFQKRILFLDKSDRNGVASAMREHDFLVVASEVETFSLVTVEAFASGLPVLSTRCGGPEGLIIEPGLGRLVSNDVDGLASGLLEMYRQIDTFDRHYIADVAARNYSWDSVASKLAELYGELVYSA